MGDPVSAYNPPRIDSIHQLLRLEPKFREWWLAALPRFIGTDGEHPWLRVRARYNSGAGHVDDELLSRSRLNRPGTAAILLEAAMGVWS